MTSKFKQIKILKIKTILKFRMIQKVKNNYNNKNKCY